MLAPLRYTSTPTKKRILDFKGYNRKSLIDDGEMRDMYNLASDEYPCLYQRKPRGLYSAAYKNPTHMIFKDEKLAVISDGHFYFDGTMYPALELSNDTRMVAINAKICFFPEKKYFDVQTKSIGNLEAEATSGMQEITVTSSTLTFTTGFNLTSKFAVGDSVAVRGTTDGAYDCDTVIQSLTDNSLTFMSDTFIILATEGQESVMITANVTISRTCPDLDFVMENNNRLWGVSNADNTIYACKLGDPTNWYYYQASSLASYAIEVGTDGEWTGIAPYSSHLLFFKDACIHKIFGSTPATFTLATSDCHALEKGSSDSIATINGVVLYKSRLGIMAYQGGVPELISANFGSEKYTDVVAGTDGIKYFISAMRGNVAYMLVFDMERVLWHKEDNARARCFAYHAGKLIYIDDNTGNIIEIDSDNPIEDDKRIKWSADIGPFDEYLEETKIFSKLKMRLELEEGSELSVFIQVDNGEWEKITHLYAEHRKAIALPIVPRVCNRFAVRYEGVGRCKIESIVREYRQGSERRP